ncbi:helix-turn-helix domain-containing protein [Mariniflexile gromovii]|uniref:Helix-turn-helix transcriptional regulator n=1 Tax=Mariniflexile gromovii TaxID=362523 RepID=A0ABS4BYD8_9FLAO|nr:helix-turn-helix transcriptional regulator [Mariniflexile gromovii]MBP0905598.1 helix-turn-helix transcriptional regulator [Mariniflexile gromovii]
MINVKDKKFIKAFGKNLKKIRKDVGLSQEDLANDADIPLSQVGRIERGEVNTTISTVYVLATALKINITDLFNFDKNKKGSN